MRLFFFNQHLNIDLLDCRNKVKVKKFDSQALLVISCRSEKQQNRNNKLLVSFCCSKIIQF